MTGETTWDGFSEKIFSGSARLKVDAGIADQAARQAADVLDAVQSVLAKRFAGRMNEGQVEHGALQDSELGFGYKGFGQLNSGTAMTAMFTKLDSNLADALHAQEKILAEMGNAFSCAAKGYQDTEEESKSYFTSLKPGANNGPYDIIDHAVLTYVGAVYGKGVNVTDWGDGKNAGQKNNFDTSHKGAPVADSGFKATYLGSLEPEQNIGAPEILKLIDADGIRIVEAGAVWKAWASYLQGKFDNYSRSITAIRDNGQWTGSGIDSIVVAINSYMTQVHSLTETIWAVGDLLVYAGGWVNTTSSHARTAHADHMGDERKMAEDFRPYFKAIYQYGWNQTFNSMPGIPSPSAMVSPFTPGTGGDPKVTGAGVNPSGGGTPSSPSLTAQPNIETPNPDANPVKDNPVKDNPVTETPKTTTTTDPTTQITSLMSTLAQQGASLAQSLASTGSSLIQSLAKTTTDTTKSTTDDLAKQLSTLTNLPTSPTDTKTPGGSPKSPGGGSPSAGIPRETTTQSRLFPRSTVSSTDKEETVTATRAGLATGSATTTGTGTTGSSGMPMSGAGAQGAGQGAGKEHKRPEFLRSGENLDEVFEDIPAAVRSVAEK